jgi:hypothetical protein
MMVDVKMHEMIGVRLLMRRLPSLGSKPGLEVAEMMLRAVALLSRKKRARKKRKEGASNRSHRAVESCK